MRSPPNNGPTNGATPHGAGPLGVRGPQHGGQAELGDEDAPPPMTARLTPFPSSIPGGPRLGSGFPGAVNNPQEIASNQKQVRQREAEEDRVLIANAQNGDASAFRALVQRHQRRAFAIAVSLVRDENDAKELVQEAFLRVYRNLGNFEGGSSFFTWLYRIITNLSIDLIRKPGRQAVDPDAARESTDDSGEVDFPLVSRIDGADPADVVRRGEIGNRLREALDALPDYHRGVILMREVEGMSYEEIAESMGVSKGTVMSRLFHARQKLQRVLVDCYQEQVGRMPAKGGSDGADDERRFDASDDVTEEGQ